MTQAILCGLGGGLGGAMLVLAMQWWLARHRRRYPFVYIWPVPGQPSLLQEPECDALALYTTTVRQEQERARFSAQWDSGLGSDFPRLGRN